MQEPRRVEATSAAGRPVVARQKRLGPRRREQQQQQQRQQGGPLVGVQGWRERVSEGRQQGECLRWRGSRWVRRAPPASEWVREGSNKREVGGRGSCKCYRGGGCAGAATAGRLKGRWWPSGRRGRRDWRGHAGATPGRGSSNSRKAGSGEAAGRRGGLGPRRRISGCSNNNSRKAGGGGAGMTGAGIEERQQEEYLR